MPDRENKFLDSNILIYAYFDREKDKQIVCRKLISNNKIIISTQVLQEMSNVLNRKFNASYDTIKALLLECVSNCNEIHTNTQGTIFLACDIAKRYDYSYYDSLIIASALECSCSVLYSEDMQHGQVLENTLKIVNPFV
jgi:predicted nucleic acid-binding protein